jgi:hypothetical protein
VPWGVELPDARQNHVACTIVLGALLAFGTTGCTSYQYAKNLKMVSFDDNVRSGHAAGPVRGESCQAAVMGYPIGAQASLDTAMADARGRINFAT